MGILAQARGLFMAKRLANEIEKEVGSNMDWKKTIGKGVKDFFITTASGVGGLLLEAAARTIGTFFSDPANVEHALAGFPKGIGLALTPVLSGLAYSALNWAKHRTKEVANG